MQNLLSVTHDSPSRRTIEQLLTILCVVTVFVLLTVTYKMFIDSDAFMPRCSACDVAGYWMTANHYHIHGLFGPMHGYANIRTYVFPSLLSLILTLAETLHLNPRALLAGFQTVAYISSCWFLAKVATQSKNMQAGIFIALACNPFIIPYLIIGLADAFALACFQVWLGMMLVHWQKILTTSESQSFGSIWIVVAAVVAGFAVEIRPAYVWLPAITLLFAIWSPGSRWSDLWSKRLARSFICAAMAVLPMIPQSLINAHHFDRWTPLLVADLQGYQAKLGKANIKFMTRVNPNGADGVAEGFGLLYANPFYDPTEDASLEGQPMSWYLDRPAPAFMTIVAKFTSIFDFDFVEPYVRDLRPDFQLGFRLASLALLFLGICGMTAHLMGLLGNRVVIGPTWFPLVILIGWGAVTMVTVPELRYSLPMLPVFSLLGFSLLAEVTKGSWRAIGLVAITVAASTSALLSIANFVRDAVPFR